MKAYGTILRADGTRDRVESAHEESEGFSLEELQKLVGGYIEIVDRDYIRKEQSGRILVVNEEGMLEQLPINLQATRIAHQPIVGNVFLVNSDFVK